MVKRMKYSTNSLLMGAVIIAVVVGLVMYMRIDGFQAAGSAAAARQRGSGGGGGARRGSGAKKAAGNKPKPAMAATPAMMGSR